MLIFGKLHLDMDRGVAGTAHLFHRHHSSGNDIAVVEGSSHEQARCDGSLCSAPESPGFLFPKSWSSKAEGDVLKQSQLGDGAAFQRTRCSCWKQHDHGDAVPAEKMVLENAAQRVV